MELHEDVKELEGSHGALLGENKISKCVQYDSGLSNKL